jgi:hypothetical protein
MPQERDNGQKRWTSACRIVALAAIVALAIGYFLRPDPSSAQQTSGDAALAAGPSGGVWVLTGQRIRFCIPGPIQRGIEPAAPLCGPAISVP